MVKSFGIIMICLLSWYGLSQNLSLGVGINVQNSQVGFNDQFGFDMLDTNGDTLILSAIDLKLTPIYSVPIYLRYNSKKNWWLQLDYSYERWRLDLNGETNHTTAYISGRVNQKINSAWLSYKQSNWPIMDTVQYVTDSINYYSNATKALYGANENALTKLSFNNYEEVQYNKISLAIGSSFNNRGKVKMFYGGGINFIITSTFESYQGFEYNNPKINQQFKILEKLPKLEDNKIAPFIKLGLEKQNLRLGLDVQWFKDPASGAIEHERTNWIVDNRFDSQTVKYAFNYGLHVNYTIFNQNFGQKDIESKGRVLDPKIIGKYKERPKLFRFGFSAHFPSFYNSGWSILDGFGIDDGDSLNHELMNKILDNKNDGYLTGVHVDDDEIEDNIYLEKRVNDIFVNNNGLIDTNVIYQTLFFAWGNLNTIIRSPKISGFVNINPHPLASIDLNAGYQKLTLGIVAYESERYAQNGEKFITMRKLLYQENFNEVSLGMNLNVHKQISNTSKLGVHFGMNINTWLRGRFNIETGGVNDSELLQDFHQYFINGRQKGEWNRNINPVANKGVFSKQDYLLHNYKPNSAIAERKSYHTDFSDYLFDTRKKRRTLELRFGADYYIDNFKFTAYGEKSLWKVGSLYNDLLTFGFGVSMFLN